MKKNLIWIVAAAFSLVLGQSAFAGDCGKGIEMMGRFNLDAAQKEKAKPILEQYKATMQAGRAQIRELRMQINQKVQSDNMDQSAVDSLVDQKTKLMGDMMKARISAKHQIYMLLNEKQKANVQEITKKVHAKMNGRIEECQAQKQDQEDDQE